MACCLSPSEIDLGAPSGGAWRLLHALHVGAQELPPPAVGEHDLDLLRSRGLDAPLAIARNAHALAVVEERSGRSEAARPFRSHRLARESLLRRLRAVVAGAAAIEVFGFLEIFEQHFP